MLFARGVQRMGDPARALTAGDVLLWPARQMAHEAEVVLKVVQTQEDGGLDLALQDAHGRDLASVRLGGKPGGWWLDETLAHPAVQGLERQMQRWLRQRSPSSAAKPRGLVWALGLSAAALALSAAAFATTGYLWLKVQAVSAASGYAAAEPVAMHAAPAPASDELGLEQLSILQEVVARSGFSLNKNGALVVMFADPVCPACRQFEDWMREDGYKTFAPLVVPVAFKGGAKDLAATVLCVKGNDEQAKAWAQANAGTLASKPCEEGLRQVDLNNAAFEALGLTATPSFVAVNGKKMTGAKPLAEMAAWAAQNTPSNIASKPAQ